MSVRPQPWTSRRHIALGLSGKGVEQFLMQNAAIIECVKRVMDDRLSLPVKNRDLFGAGDVAKIAKNVFLRCALESTIIRGTTLELFLTSLRYALLRVAETHVPDPATVDGDVLGLFCALAQQCFLNEYVFAQGGDETQRASQLRALLLQKLSAGSRVSPLSLAAVAAYFPLHALLGAESLLAAEWPPCAADLLRQQVREPLDEAEDRRAIPALTIIDDGISLQVMRQYEENPYPRWTMNQLAVLGGNVKEHLGAADGGEAAPLRRLARRLISPQSHLINACFFARLHRLIFRSTAIASVIRSKCSDQTNWTGRRVYV
jgi:hypothetical protein